MQEEKICPHCGFANNYAREICVECGKVMTQQIDPKTWSMPAVTRVTQRSPFSLSLWSYGALAAVVILLLVRLFLVIGQQATESLKTFWDLQEWMEIMNALALFSLALGLFSAAMDIAGWLESN